jgi:DNA-directed RNA polymerase subunit RPC12/RpoP
MRRRFVFSRRQHTPDVALYKFRNDGTHGNFSVISMMGKYIMNRRRRTMDNYKLSCPRCGQHIAYTKDYCGKRVHCPSCGGDVVFPAIPPGAHQPLRLERDRPKVKERFHFDPRKILAATVSFLRNFEHWQVVAMCMLPFALIVIGLAAATFVRNSDSDGKPTEPTLSASQVAENKRIAELNKLEIIVQDRVRSCWNAKNAVDVARRKSAVLHNTYDGKQLSPGMRSAVDAQYKVADEEIATAQSNLGAWRTAFDTEFGKYQKLGGKVDYQSQLPR